MKSSLNKALLLTLIASTVSASALESTSALSTLGSAIKTDATAFASKATECAQTAQVKAQGWFESTKNSLVNAHAKAESRTTSFGQWIQNNPNTTMIIAAAAVLGYSVYKIRQMYQTYKRGAQTATINVNVRNK